MFRLRAKAILLTYAQINNDQLNQFISNPSAHSDFVTQAFGPPVVYRSGRESHADGGIHIHVFIAWEDRINSSNERCFDFAQAHPNIKPIPRTPIKAWEYAGKDDNIIHEYGSPPRGSGTPSNGRDGIWRDALAETTKEGFLGHIRTMAPRDYVIYFETLERFAERHYHAEPAPYESPPFTVRDPGRLDVALLELQLGQRGGGRPKSLILSGPTRTGKTVWARSLGKQCAPIPRWSPAVQPPQPALRAGSAFGTDPPAGHPPWGNGSILASQWILVTLMDR